MSHVTLFTHMLHAFHVARVTCHMSDSHVTRIKPPSSTSTGRITRFVSPGQIVGTECLSKSSSSSSNSSSSSSSSSNNTTPTFADHCLCLTPVVALAFAAQDYKVQPQTLPQHFFSIAAFILTAALCFNLLCLTLSQAILKYSRQGQMPALVRLLHRLPFLGGGGGEGGEGGAMEALALDMNVRT